MRPGTERVGGQETVVDRHDQFATVTVATGSQRARTSTIRGQVSSWWPSITTARGLVGSSGSGSSTGAERDDSVHHVEREQTPHQARVGGVRAGDEVDDHHRPVPAVEPLGGVHRVVPNELDLFALGAVQRDVVGAAGVGETWERHQ